MSNTYFPYISSKDCLKGQVEPTRELRDKLNLANQKPEQTQSVKHTMKYLSLDDTEKMRIEDIEF